MQIILFRGRPGVGKTTPTNAFIKKHPYFLIRKDDLYDVASEVLTEHHARNKIAYDGLYTLLASNVMYSKSDFRLSVPARWRHTHHEKLVSSKQCCF